jgi:outer membrane protein assembly factor BamB
MKTIIKTFPFLVCLLGIMALISQPMTGVIANGEPTQALYLPIVLNNALQGSEWSQHAFNAQRTSFNPSSISTPWRWKWSWNGPNSNGGIINGKFRLPRNSQPVTGGGRVYVAAGVNGVYALNNANGTMVWNFRPTNTSANSTPAYDAETNALFVLFSNGVLYKLNAANGSILGQVNGGAQSDLPLPPAIFADRVYFGIGNAVFALNKHNLQIAWQYNAESAVHTPPAYSASRHLVIVATQDLYVHAIRAENGTQAWRVKQTVLTPGDPNGSSNNAEVSRGWPVIAEQHGLVLIKLRLDWQTLWTFSPWPATNAQMRANLQSDPTEQALLALNLDNGAVAFIANVGHGGFGDGNYMPMGPMPVVKRFADGNEVAYVVMRGYPCLDASPYCDGRGDSRLGEMLLDDSTVSGYQAGYVRFMQNTYFPTDEQAYISMAGDQIFAAHWEAGIAHQISDRSPSRGTGANPITTTSLPHIATSQDQDVCGSGFLLSHYCAMSLINTRQWPGGFYIYWRQGAVYDQYWSEYAQWVISSDSLYFVSTDGAVVALEHGQPTLNTSPALAPTDVTAPAPARTIMEPISPEQTWLHVGEIVTVEGTIQEVFNNQKAVYITFHKPHQGKFIVRILKQFWQNFPQPPENLYTPGSKIRITGRLEWYQGAPVIYISRPEAIQPAPQAGQ